MGKYGPEKPPYLDMFHAVTHIQNPLKDLTYSEPSQRFEFFAKIVESYNYFSKALRLRSLTGF